MVAPGADAVPGGEPSLGGMRVTSVHSDGDDDDAIRVERRYRQLIGGSPDAIWVHDGERILYANAAGVQWMAAGTAEQLVGRPITDVIHPDYLAGMLERIAALRSEGEVSALTDAVLLRVDGTTMEVEAVSMRTVWNGLPAYQVVFRDISLQKAAELSIRTRAALIASFGDPVIETTLDGIVTSWNRAAQATYGRAEAEVLGVPVAEAVGAPVDLSDLLAGAADRTATHHRADGAELFVRISVATMPDGLVLICADHTAMYRTEQRFGTVVNSLDEGIVVVDGGGHVEWMNSAASRMVAVAVGDRLQIDGPLVNPAGGDVAHDSCPVVRTLATGETVVGHIVGVDRDPDERLWLSISTRRLNADDPDDQSVLVSFADVTTERLAREQLTYDATHDELTGLANRAYATSRVSQALAGGSDFALRAVLFIDVDNLKDINDTLGHHAGDHLLREAARQLRQAVRVNDIVARLGGDEFVCLLHSPVESVDLHGIAERIQTALARPVDYDGVMLTAGACIGITLIEPSDERDATQVLRDADLAMYEAKSAGRNRIHYFTTALRLPRDTR